MLLHRLIKIILIIAINTLTQSYMCVSVDTVCVHRQLHSCVEWHIRETHRCGNWSKEGFILIFSTNSKGDLRMALKFSGSKLHYQ